MLSGEYWIKPYGVVVYADGDAGGMNHSDHAIQAAASWLREIVADCDDEPLKEILQDTDATAAYNGDPCGFRTALLDAADAWMKNQRNLDPEVEERLDDISGALEAAGVPRSLLDALWDSECCPRDWARKSLGWISLAKERIALYGLTDKKAGWLKKGLWDIAEQEGIEHPDALQFDVYDAKTDTRYPVGWALIQEGCAALYSPLVRRVSAAVGQDI